MKRFFAWIARKLLAFAAIVLIFVIFLGGIIVAYGITARMRIINEDAFFPLGLFLGMILGAIIAGLSTRKMEHSKFKEYLIALIVISMLSITPASLALINVKLDFRASRPRFGQVIIQSTRINNKSLPIRDFDDSHTFFWLRVKPETYDRLVGGGQIQLATRPGLLGFEWIEHIHEPVQRTYWSPSPSPAPPPPDPEKTLLEKPLPESTPVERQK